MKQIKIIANTKFKMAENIYKYLQNECINK